MKHYTSFLRKAMERVARAPSSVFSPAQREAGRKLALKLPVVASGNRDGVIPEPLVDDE
jgi:hypothetical protein